MLLSQFLIHLVVGQEQIAIHSDQVRLLRSNLLDQRQRLRQIVMHRIVLFHVQRIQHEQMRRLRQLGPYVGQRVGQHAGNVRQVHDVHRAAADGEMKAKGDQIFAVHDGKGGDRQTWHRLEGSEGFKDRHLKRGHVPGNRDCGPTPLGRAFFGRFKFR